MGTVTLINIQNIEKTRLPVNRASFNLARFLYRNELDKPIRVKLLKNGQYRVKDGRHRITAHKLLGRPAILADICEVE